MKDIGSKPRPKTGEGVTAATRSAPLRVSSNDLLPRGQPLHIEHEGELYILRRTSNNKLILTK
ncbi:hemin uptake protein HemP [Thiohalomonas denitrificans]|uniref:Hemin uptake protein HemP n=1 Tax=Thiohalomonas denitrificans TaxID=415747 RepID=A0A1G5Q6V7_9GAMM|nr:hemin uptake protein HemP [Thiohalomonas denitrificans]SCZ57563.1 Hemin uptake protein HemP [Thiohalomonas denitrificans]